MSLSFDRAHEFRQDGMMVNGIFNRPQGAMGDLNDDLANLNVLGGCQSTNGNGGIIRDTQGLIGIGIVVDGKIIKGLSHPEGGHICVRRQPGDSYAGNCPFHRDCLEGMANSQSIADRCGCTLKELIGVRDNDPVWRTVAFYLAQMCVALTCLITPEVIVLGGGILNRGQLYGMVQEEFRTLMNEYLVHPRLTTKAGVAKYICASRFGSKAGAIGSVVLAQIALEVRGTSTLYSKLLLIGPRRAGGSSPQ